MYTCVLALVKQRGTLEQIRGLSTAPWASIKRKSSISHISWGILSDWKRLTFKIFQEGQWRASMKGRITALNHRRLKWRNLVSQKKSTVHGGAILVWIGLSCTQRQPSQLSIEVSCTWAVLIIPALSPRPHLITGRGWQKGKRQRVDREQKNGQEEKESGSREGEWVPLVQTQTHSVPYASGHGHQRRGIAKKWNHCMYAQTIIDVLCNM